MNTCEKPYEMCVRVCLRVCVIAEHARPFVYYSYNYVCTEMSYVHTRCLCTLYIIV